MPVLEMLCTVTVGEHTCIRKLHAFDKYHHCNCGGRWLQTSDGEVIDWIEP